MFFKVLHVSRSNKRGYLVNQNNLMLQKFDPRPKKMVLSTRLFCFKQTAINKAHFKYYLARLADNGYGISIFDEILMTKTRGYSCLSVI